MIGSMNSDFSLRSGDRTLQVSAPTGMQVALALGLSGSDGPPPFFPVPCSVPGLIARQSRTEIACFLRLQVRRAREIRFSAYSPLSTCEASYSVLLALASETCSIVTYYPTVTVSLPLVGFEPGAMVRRREVE